MKKFHAQNIALERVEWKIKNVMIIKGTSC